MDFQAEPTLIDFIRYNNWANAQLLAACQKLDATQLAAAAPGSYGTIRATLRHMISAEADYIGRITGQRLEPPFKWEDEPAIADIAPYAEQVAAAFLEVVQRVPPLAMVHEEENGFFVDYQARLLYLQVVIHGVEHRTNITTILSSLGIATHEIDAWGYAFTHQEEFAWKEGKV